jgi:TPR repeat protein
MMKNGGGIGEKTTTKTDAELVASCKAGNALDCSKALMIAKGTLKSDGTAELDQYELSVASTNALTGKHTPDTVASVESLNNINIGELSKSLGIGNHKSQMHPNRKEDPEKSDKGIVSSITEKNIDIAKEERLKDSCTQNKYKECFELALAYETGTFVQKSDLKALEYYSKSCEGKIDGGCYSAGLMYINGIGILKDSSKAVSFYTKSCEYGNAKGCYTLGEFYQNGNYVDQSMKKAFALFSKSCQLDHAPGCFRLAKVYAEGIDGTYDDKVMKYYRKACKNKMAEACVELGVIYEKSDKYEYRESVEMYQKGCDMGDFIGCRKLGNMYRKGKGVDKNSDIAKNLFARGCDNNDGPSCFLLGYMHENDLRLPTVLQKEKAYYMYQQACGLGVKQGCEWALKIESKK